MEHTHLAVQIMFFGSLLSAIMSTTSSAVLAPAAIFSKNMVQPLLQKSMDDREMLVLTRVSVLLFSLIATVMAMLRSNIYELVGESSILSLVTLFAPLTLGLYWKRANGTGAVWAMIMGFLAWLLFEFVTPVGVPSLVPSTLVSLAAMVGASLLGGTKSVPSAGKDVLL